MIGEPADMLDHWRRRTVHLVGGIVDVSPAPVAKAAFYAPAKPLRSNRMPRKMASSCRIAFSETPPLSNSPDMSVFCVKTEGFPVMNIQLHKAPVARTLVSAAPRLIGALVGPNIMKRLISASALLVLISPALLQKAAAQTAPAPDPHSAMLTTYCVTCHNARLKTGGIAFDALDLQGAPDDAQIWEKALRKLRGHLMPPPGAPQPPQRDIDSFVDWMENTLATHAKGPKAGH